VTQGGGNIDRKQTWTSANMRFLIVGTGPRVFFILFRQLNLTNRFARIFVANQGSDDDACPEAREEELIQICSKKPQRYGKV